MLIGLAGGIPFQYSKSITGQIAALFAQGEKGVHFDPSDFSTLFQDSAGTTPVTAVGQTVGLMLDKSKGLVLGSELVDLTPDTIQANWTNNGDGTYTSNGSGYLTWSTNIPTGKTYKISFTIISRTSGGVSEISTISEKTAVGTYSGYLPATAVNLKIYGNAFVGTIGNITCREIYGYHATQATSTARPILGRHPITGRRNLLTYTEDFSNAAWGKTGAGTGLTAVVTNNYTAAPDGTVTAARVLLDVQAGRTAGDYSRIMQNISTGDASFRVWLKSNTTDSYQIQLWITSVVQTVTVTPTWQEFIVSRVGPNSNFQIIYFGNNALTNQADLAVWHPQGESGLVATAYQKVVSTYDVTEAGVNDAYYLQFDGVDDFLVMPSIDFSGTDKMSVFAGVRKLSDAAVAVALEHGVGGVDAMAATLLNAPRSAGVGNYGIDIRAGGLVSTSTSTGTYIAPVTSVVTTTADYAGTTIPTEVVTRVNGSATGNTTFGTGPLTSTGFGNYPLYIGMRAGTSLPFNGHLYSLVVRGALSDASQIASGEVYCNSKTGAY